MFGAQAAACGSQASSDVLRQYGNRIVATSDLDKQVRDDLHSSGEDGDVGIVRADFDGNGVKDFAVLTKEAGLESKLTVRLVMCKKACRESQVFDVGVFSGFQYLTKVKAGATIAPAEAAGESKEHARQITNPAVRFNEYAKTHTTYYWDASTNSFRELATGD